MKETIKIIALLLLVHVWTEATIAADYYVDSAGGNDLNTGGSPQQAWQTLQKVNATLFAPGDKILFKAGTRYLGQFKPQGSGSLIEGRANAIVVDRYGEGPAPCIDAAGKYQAALDLYNVEYWEINGLELTNQGEEREASRCGVYVHIEDFGTAHHIQLKNLYIHDVNGSLVKKEGGGSAIKYRNGGRGTRSRFDGFLIEGCHIARCERNAITGSGYANRRDWFPNLNLVIRRNLIEQVPGDGIVPNACEGALVESNVMRDCPRLLPPTEAAAGIWPWSSDNTVIQFNEVSDHKAPWDAQGFDADWNCVGTVIQYNYSHDNEGGFLLVCNNGKSRMPYNIGNQGTIIRYNLSVNDGIRQQPTRAGIFSPTFHISGPCEDTQIYNNTIYISKKPTADIDRTLVKMDNWGGPWPVNTRFYNNIFYVEGETSYDYGKAQNTIFNHNLYYGTHANAPEDAFALRVDPLFVDPDRNQDWAAALEGFRLRLGSPCIGAGIQVEQNGGRDFSSAEVPTGRPPTLGAMEVNVVSRPAQNQPVKLR